MALVINQNKNKTYNMKQNKKYLSKLVSIFLSAAKTNIM